MSSRHLKAAAQAPSLGPLDDDDDEDAPELRQQRPAASFAALLGDDSDDGIDDDDSDDAIDDDDDATAATAPLPAAAAAPPPRPTNRERRRANKAQDDDDDDDDALLARAAAAQPAAAQDDDDGADAAAPADPWALSAEHLDVSTEQGRIFGRATLRALAAAERAVFGGRGHGGRGRGSARKTLLVKPRDQWPPLTGTGLGMETCADGSFAFTQSAAYRLTQLEVDAAVNTADPNVLQRLLGAYPYQLDALLRLSDYCSRTGQHERSAELVERALYACEGALHPLCRLATGRVRMRWSVAENRPFFDALKRHAFGCARRGCPRTALELCRLLASLDPAADPLHALLHLDYLALRASEPAVVLTLPAALPAHSLPLYPSFAFSTALALRALGRAADAGAQLDRALLLFPAALDALTAEGAIAPAGAQWEAWQAEFGARARVAETGATLATLLRLWGGRHAELWKRDGAARWLEERAAALLAALRRGGADGASASLRRLRDDCAAVAAAEYGGAAARHDEFADVDREAFSAELPEQMPDDDAPPPPPPAAGEQAGGGAWRNEEAAAEAAARRAQMGRLVVPRDEWEVLEEGAGSGIARFFKSLLPWVVVEKRRRD